VPGHAPGLHRESKIKVVDSRFYFTLEMIRHHYWRFLALFAILRVASSDEFDHRETKAIANDHRSIADDCNNDDGAAHRITWNCQRPR